MSKKPNPISINTDTTRLLAELWQKYRPFANIPSHTIPEDNIC